MLAAEYRDNPLAFGAGIADLSARYGGLRRVRGDGNCFYRAFYVSWMERLASLSAVEQREVWAHLMPSRSAALALHLPAALAPRRLTSHRLLVVALDQQHLLHHRRLVMAEVNLQA